MAPAHPAQLAHHLPLGQITDRTGVENKEVGPLLVFDRDQPPLFQLPSHDLCVELVHLAAISANKICLWLIHSLR